MVAFRAVRETQKTPLAPSKGEHRPRPAWEASPSARTSPGAILALQRKIGNRAVVGMLGQGRPPVQRVLATQPSDLDHFISTMDVIKGGVGKTSEPKRGFAAIRSALSDYQSEAKKGKADPEIQAGRLAIVDALCTRFLKEAPRDKKRRPIIDRLLDEIGSERAALSRLQGQQIYQGNVENSSPDGSAPIAADETDPAKKFAFQGLGETGKLVATDYNSGEQRDRRKKLEEEKAKYGLTAAEISAIAIFSAGDFRYINPATANSSSWLASNKASLADRNERYIGVDDKTLKEEGSLHTAVALQGLAKMERYKGESYRGARFTPKEFNEKFAVGKKTSFTTLASSSFDKGVAVDFAHGTGVGTKPTAEQTVAVITVLTDSGVNISNIAMSRSEAEVVILPGSWFKVTSFEEVDGNVEYRSQLAEVARKNLPVPTKWYIVRLSATEADAAPTKPAKKWGSASATGPQLPLSTPIDEYLRKAGRPARGTVGGHR